MNFFFNGIEINKGNYNFFKNLEIIISISFIQIIKFAINCEQLRRFVIIFSSILSDFKIVLLFKILLMPSRVASKPTPLEFPGHAR